MTDIWLICQGTHCSEQACYQKLKWLHENQIHGHFVLKEGVPVTIGNPAFWLALYLTGVHFRAELQHVGDVSEQKRKYGPIRTREIGGARLSEALYVNEHKTIKQD